MSRGFQASPDRRSPSGPTSTPPDFGKQFRDAFRVLWLIALGVVQDRTLAEDVVQEAALVGLSKIDEFKPGTNFTAWMGRIVELVALNQARSRRRRRTVPLEAEQIEPAAPLPRADQPDGLRLTANGHLPIEQELFDDRIMAALRRVPRTPRICLLLRTVEDLEYAEIARVLRIPEGTAMSHVHRTRQLLRRELADLRPPGAALPPADSRAGASGGADVEADGAAEAGVTP